MTRKTLSLYELDRGALKALTAELKGALLQNDARSLATILELGGSVADSLETDECLVERFLLPADDPQCRVLMASLRRVSKKRALTPLFTSEKLSLEEQLRGYEALRDDKATATLIDKLLDSNRLPWYLRRKGGSGGWLNGRQGQELKERLHRLRAVLSPELAAFADGLSEASTDVIAHDNL